MLEELLERIIQDMNVNKISDRVISFEDYKTKYVVPKNKATVCIELTSGKIFKIDITDYLFKEDKN